MEEEPYRHSEKFTLIFCIGVDGFRYLNFNDRAGTGVIDVLSFLGGYCNMLDEGEGDHRYCFLYDNVTSRKSPMVYDELYSCGYKKIKKTVKFILNPFFLCHWKVI